MEHLVCMKLFLLLSAIVFLSCSSDDIYRPAKKKAGNISVQSASIHCNYFKYKNDCKNLVIKYQAAPDRETKQALLKFIRDSLFTCWLGTPWDFNGTTEEPGNGKIACGYFVTTVLRDMGVKVNRIQHAQCPSEEMIKAVCVSNSIKRFSNQNIPAFIEKINEYGEGLYIVGLDFHTGFILNDGDETYFVHANYAGKKMVEKEIAVESIVLSNSKYKVIGRVI